LITARRRSITEGLSRPDALLTISPSTLSQFRVPGRSKDQTDTSEKAESISGGGSGVSVRHTGAIKGAEFDFQRGPQR
jgi:hypothetical protein